MKTVNISDLKARLSAHIERVRRGETVLVCERNRPVARIVPCRPEDHSEQELRLIARGVLNPPVKRRRSSRSWPKPPGSVSDEAVRRVLHEERKDR